MVLPEQEQAEVYASALSYRRAFAFLHRARGDGPSGFPCPLVYSEVVAFGRDAGLCDTPEDLEDYIYLIYEQDDEYLKYERARAAARAARETSK